MKGQKYVTPDQEGDTFTMRYSDRGEVIETGTLSELATKYLAFCNSRTDLRHGPATLRHEGEDCGFINARGEVYLSQPSSRKVTFG